MKIFHLISVHFNFNVQQIYWVNLFIFFVFSFCCVLVVFLLVPTSKNMLYSFTFKSFNSLWSKYSLRKYPLVVGQLKLEYCRIKQRYEIKDDQIGEKGGWRSSVNAKKIDIRITKNVTDDQWISINIFLYCIAMNKLLFPPPLVYVFNPPLKKTKT